MSGKIIIAVAKGRIFENVVPLLHELGIAPTETSETTRKLILETYHLDIKLIIVRAIDVPTYVEYGAADIGITGRDVLLESGSNGLYELLDMKIAKCKMVVAAPKQAKIGDGIGRRKIATKYVNVTHNYFANQGKQVEIVKLYGSVELAPILGLADQIVDLVDTGDTLKANDLVEVEHIMDISSMLIANKGAMKMKSGLIQPILEKLERVIGAK